ncbi:restriction endonuclease subunit S [Marivita cryptomonadis]|jgi:type I restriction enzyme S subunit|uniref:restriction endonuclease subunit S n=1 Tax=Marivita cryptomonadis TaxID=505252 RepID=UPI000A1DD0B7|nr:restriction endonuclease subunit S [Marivita cryptomonadis]
MNDVIPDDWELVNLGALGSFAKGAGIRKDEALSGEIPAVRYGELYTDHPEILRAHRSFISPEISKSARPIKCGDILFAGSGETKEEIGKCTGFLGDYEAFVGGDIIVFRPNGPDPRFLAYMLNSAPIAKQKAQRAQGDAVVHIYPDALSRLSLPLPPLHEQQSIAAALSDADGVVAGLERVIAKKRLIKQGAMQDLLTARRRLPGFSGEWVQRKLGTVAMLQRGFDLPNSIRRDGDYPVVYSNGVMANHSAFMCEGPGVVTGRSGTIGNVTFVAGKYWPHNTALWVKNFFGNSPRFIYYLLDFIDLRRFASGSGVPTLNRNDAHDEMISVPTDIDEQDAICAVLDDMDAEIQALESRLTKARAVKEGMMQNLLTGRVRLV